MSDETFKILDTFPFPLPLSREDIFIFDADGVVCECLPWEKEKLLTMEQFRLIKRRTKCTSSFIKTAKFLHKYDIPYLILTGRKISSQKITESMFSRAGLPFIRNVPENMKIIFYPDNKEYFLNDYFEYKAKILQYYTDIYNHVYFFDDSRELIDHLSISITNSKLSVYYYFAGLFDLKTHFPEISKYISSIV
ncbi:MAG: hypothetical protein ACTSWY_05575 [Promethearchaeota archaeon]